MSRGVDGLRTQERMRIEEDPAYRPPGNVLFSTDKQMLCFVAVDPGDCSLIIQKLGKP